MMLFLDDIRSTIEVYVYTNNPLYRKEWRVVRNFEEFKSCVIAYYPEITHISFDHDLGEDEAIRLVSEGVPKRKARTIKKLCESGKDCANWLIEYIINNKLQLPIIYCHSLNPVGKENILKLFENYKLRS